MKQRLLIWIITGSVILISICAWISLVVYGVYRGEWEDGFTRFGARIFMLSVASGPNIRVTYSEYLLHVKAERTFLAGPAARALGYSSSITAEQKAKALDRAIRIHVVERMGQEKGIEITPLDVERAYNELILSTSSSTNSEEIHQFLFNQFGWNESEFKRYVIRPAMMEDALKSKYYLNTKDTEAFGKELQKRIDQVKKRT